MTKRANTRFAPTKIASIVATGRVTLQRDRGIPGKDCVGLSASVSWRSNAAQVTRRGRNADKEPLCSLHEAARGMIHGLSLVLRKHGRLRRSFLRTRQGPRGGEVLDETSEAHSEGHTTPSRRIPDATVAPLQALSGIGHGYHQARGLHVASHGRRSNLQTAVH